MNRNCMAIAICVINFILVASSYSQDELVVDLEESSSFFKAKVTAHGLKGRYKYLISINATEEDRATNEVLKKIDGCKINKDRGYCDLDVFYTDDSGLL